MVQSTRIRSEGATMKEWVRQVRALTATMIEVRKDRARLERRYWELRAGAPEGGASFMLLSGLSRAEVLGMAMCSEAEPDPAELRRAEAELRDIDETLTALDRKVRVIAEAEACEERIAGRPSLPHVPTMAANVVPFRPRVQSMPAPQGLTEVA
jgi:hypothetical protein